MLSLAQDPDIVEYVNDNPYEFCTRSHHRQPMVRFKDDCTASGPEECECGYVGAYKARHDKSIITIAPFYDVHVDTDTGTILCERLKFAAPDDNGIRGIVFREGKCRENHWGAGSLNGFEEKVYA